MSRIDRSCTSYQLYLNSGNGSRSSSRGWSIKCRSQPRCVNMSIKKAFLSPKTKVSIQQAGTLATCCNPSRGTLSCGWILIRVLVWRELDRYKGDRDRYLINFYYMAIYTRALEAGRKQGQKSWSASAATSLHLDRKVASSIPIEDDALPFVVILALICSCTTMPILEPAGANYCNVWQPLQ